MSVFRSRGFDSLIGKGTHVDGSITIAPDSTLAVEGVLVASQIIGQQLGEKVATKTTLHVGGNVHVEPLIKVHNVIITGIVTCVDIHVEGTLAVKSGATLKAKTIYYRELVIETGAVVHGQMYHLDHISSGEQL